MKRTYLILGITVVMLAVGYSYYHLNHAVPAANPTPTVNAAAPCQSLHCRSKEHLNLSRLVNNNRHLFLSPYATRPYETLASPEIQTLWQPLLRQSHKNTTGWILPEAQHKSCALVGNSIKLKDKRFGNEIDAHDAVFRMTFAQIRGYEEDVGKRTTYRLQWSHRKTDDYDKPVFILYHYTSKSTLPHNYMDWLSYVSAKYQRLPAPEREAYNKKSIRFSSPANFPKNRFLIVDNAAIVDANRQWLGVNKAQGMSAGLLGIMLGMHMCESVTLYGYTTSEDTNLCYYYDRGDATCRLQEKSDIFKQQIAWIESLEKQGYLSIRQ